MSNMLGRTHLPHIGDNATHGVRFAWKIMTKVLHKNVGQNRVVLGMWT